MIKEDLVSEPLKILVVGGHPADIFDNAGGTLLHHIQKGDQVTALALTPGARVHDVVVREEMRKKKEIPPADVLNKIIEERVAIKKQEIIDACAVFSIHDVRFLEFDDSVLMLKEEIVLEIARVIRSVRPHIVITHYPFDNGGIADQHSITANLVLNAMNAAGGVEPGDPNPPHGVAQVFLMGVPSQMIRTTALYREFNAYCDVYVDISDVIHLKLEALNKLKSQQYDGTYAKKRIEVVDGGLGFSVGVSYAEAFITYLPEVYHTLPISNYLLRRSCEPQKESFERAGRLLTSELLAKHKS